MRARIFAEENRKWWTLGAVSFGLFMIMLDNTIVNVALPVDPARRCDLEHLRARVGRQRVRAHLRGAHAHRRQARRPASAGGASSSSGSSIFTAASLACGLAPDANVLIGARVVQGVGAALMNPATLSIITATFPPRQRGTAIGDLGRRLRARARDRPARRRPDHRADQLELDLLHQRPGRRSLAIVVACARSSTSRATPRTSSGPTCPGLVTSAIGLFALTYGLIEANKYGWTSARILALLRRRGRSALVAFVLLELHQRVPMLDLSLFRNPTFAGANAVMLLVALAMFGVFFYVSLYVQNVLGYSPIQAGATFLPMDAPDHLRSRRMAGRLSRPDRLALADRRRG